MIPRNFTSALRSSVRPKLNPSWRSDWVCRSWRTNSTLEKGIAQKPYYITTPIFYVNAAPHVGHLYTMVLSDILKRWQVLKGKEAILCTGTDEHGMKIQQAAAKAGTPPKDFCDQNAEIFKLLASRVGLSNDYFIRTTDDDHKEAVQYFWQMLHDREYIYESKHEGWYCVSDETFYPESTIEKRLDPFTGRTFMASKETGKEVEWTSEKNYHFRLSAFKDELLEFYKKNPEFVVPASRMNDVVKWVSEGLEDLSVSRPVERLSWGVRVPNDETQTIYVWLDALVNYITKAGYPWAPGKENSLGWPADVQVIGKDIVRFHCIYWPAFLLALDIPPPKQVLTHAHWTLANQKMAKSTGNVVNPFFALDRFGVDTMRYYLAHDGGITNDSNYGNDHIIAKYKKGLQGGIGNLLSRTTKSKLWNIRDSIEAARDGALGATDSRTAADILLSEQQVQLLKDVGINVDGFMKQLQPGLALQAIMDVVYATNKYMQHNQPWNQITENPLNVKRTIYYSAEAMRIVGILLQPYMPDKASQLLDMIGVSPDRRTFEDSVFGADYEYGYAKPMASNILFPPLPVED